MKKETLAVTYVSVSLSNLMSTTQRSSQRYKLAQIAESIKRFGFVDPLVCNSALGRENILIGGHGRLKVAKQLNFKNVPVVYVHIPNLEKEKELNIRLHKNHGDLDFELLKDFSEDFLQDIGFSTIELDEIFDDLETVDDEFHIQKELEKIKKPVSQVGDLYQLGPHRLICGDSTDMKVVNTLVGSHKIHMVYNDPPYNIGLSYMNGIGGTKNYGGAEKDKKTYQEYKTFISQTVENALSVVNENAHIFYYCDESYVPMVAEIYCSLEIKFRRICIWLKGIANPTPQVAFSKVYEPCVYGTVGKPYLSPRHQNYDEVLNKDIGTGTEMLDNFTDMLNVWAVQRLSAQAYEHPTQKPLILHDKPIRRCTQIGDNILSLFGGSGGELIAAHQLKRKCFMIERDPIFVDLIIRRYENFTGQKALKLN